MSMFWGIVLEPGKKYEQAAESSFHLTMAALEPSTKTPTPNKSSVTSVILESNKTQFILCNLDQQRVLQQPLDCVFNEGETVSFSVNGESKVHLTGYIMPDSETDDFDEMYSSDEEDSEAEAMNDNKRKLGVEALKGAANKKAKVSNDVAKPVANAKGAKNDVAAKGAAAKKPKIADLKGGDDDDDEDEDGDESMDSEEMNSLLNQFEGDSDEEDDDEDDDNEDDESSPEVKSAKQQPQKPNQKETPVKPAGQPGQKQKTPQQQHQQQHQQQQKKPFTPYSGGNKHQNSGGKGRGGPGGFKPNQNSGRKGTPQNKFGGGGSPGQNKNKKPWAQKK